MTPRVLFLAVCFEVFYLAVGVSCLIWPQKIQDFALRYEGSKFFYYYSPFKWWVRTRYYIWQLRIIGLLALATGIFIAASILRYLITR